MVACPMYCGNLYAMICLYLLVSSVYVVSKLPVCYDTIYADLHYSLSHRYTCITLLAPTRTRPH